MAKICGFEVEVSAEFADHDGAPICQGNVYLNNELLGFWSQDAWGGEDRFEFDKTPYDDALAKMDLSYYPQFADCYRYGFVPNLDILLGEVLALNDIENMFTEITSKGYDKMLVIDSGLDRVGIGIKNGEEAKRDEIISKIALDKGLDINDVEATLYDKDSFSIGEALNI